jgi:hypothetical protein
MPPLVFESERDRFVREADERVAARAAFKAELKREEERIAAQYASAATAEQFETRLEQTADSLCEAIGRVVAMERQEPSGACSTNSSLAFAASCLRIATLRGELVGWIEAMRAKR